MIDSCAGDPSGFLPQPFAAFASPGEPDLTLALYLDDEATADPLRRFFPPKYALSGDADEFRFEGVNGRRRLLGTIRPRMGKASMDVPPLGGPWRIPEEREMVGRAVDAFVRACLQCLLLASGGTFLHAAAVAVEGEGYAFLGHTQAGKTTLTRDFPHEALLGDDLVAVRKEEVKYTLYGTPWPGREGGAVGYGDVPLKTIFILHREIPHGVERMTPAEAVADMSSNAPRLGFPSEESALLQVLSSIGVTVPIYSLSVGLDFNVPSWLREWRAGGGKKK